MKTLFELCKPRLDVISGHLKESDFAADLAQVLDGLGLSVSDSIERSGVASVEEFPGATG